MIKDRASFKLWYVAVALALFIAPAAQAITIMPVGDSITYGVGATGNATDAGYRLYLQDLLNGSGLTYDFYGTQSDGPALNSLGNPFLPEHAGYPGDRINDLRSALINDDAFPAPPGSQPDVILFMAGTNNANNKRSFNSTRSDFRSILNDIFAGAPGVHVVVSSLLPILHDPDEDTEAEWLEKQSLINQYNDYILNSLATDNNIDHNGGSISIVDMSNLLDTSLHFADHLHPNNAGYELMAQAWFDHMVGQGLIVIPEPGTIALLGTGCLLALRRRRPA